MGDPMDAKKPPGLPGSAAADDQGGYGWLVLQRLDDIQGLMTAGCRRLDRLEETLEARFDRVEGRLSLIDQRFSSIDQRFAELDGRFVAIDRRFDGMDRRFEAMEQRWTWSIGVLLVMALGVLAKLLLPGA